MDYIYLFMEPNIVFVYNIRFLRYITVRQRNGWETFELEPDEQFDHFNHEEHRPLEGKGYLLSQETINVMVKEINQQIHIQRGIKKGTEEPGDYHLVCSDAAAGSLRVGLERPKKVIGFSGFFSIGPVWKLDDKIGRTNRNEWLLEN